jgi:hypothetical protein
MISLHFNWSICEMLNLTKMCQPNWEYVNVIVLIQVNKCECFIIEHGWFKISMQDNIKINAINDFKHSPFPCNGVVCKHTRGVIHGDFKGVFDFMMDNNNLYYNFTPWEKLFLILPPITIGTCMKPQLIIFLVVNLQWFLYMFWTPWLLMILFIHHKNSSI